MLSQTRFGALDMLVLDLAPGLDRLYDATRALQLSGTVLVSHPSDHAVLAARRAIELAAGGRAGELGIVGNMVGFN